MITPDSKLGELLARWPALEQVLLDISPHFRALQNPVLRRTVAKVATLRQVAKVSGVPLGTLVTRLRAATGEVAEDGAAGGAGAEGAEDAGPAVRPPWASDTAVTRRLDARAAIEAGEHPMPAVLRDLEALGEGEVYELVTPFVPAPLVDLAAGKGYRAHSETGADGVVRTWFSRNGVA